MITGLADANKPISVCAVSNKGVSPCINPCGDCQNSCGDNPNNSFVPELITPQVRSVIGSQANATFNTEKGNIRSWVENFDLTTVSWGNVCLGVWADWDSQESPFGSAGGGNTPNTSSVPDGNYYLYQVNPEYPTPGQVPSIGQGQRSDNFCCALQQYGDGPSGNVFFDSSFASGDVSSSRLGFAHNGFDYGIGGIGGGTFTCIKSQMKLARGCRYWMYLYQDLGGGYESSNTVLRVCSGYSDWNADVPIDIPMPPVSLGAAGVVPFLTYAAFSQFMDGRLASAFPLPAITTFGPGFQRNQQCCHPTSVDPFYGCGQNPP